MKKFFSIWLFALCVSVACTSPVEEVEAVVEDEMLGFYVDFDKESRISLGNDMRYSWEGDEQLGVYVASAAPTVNCPATVQLEEGRGKCWTTTKQYVTGDKMYVYYPWNEENDMKGTSSVSLVLPTAQKQSAAGDFAVENMPMVAQPLSLDTSVSTPTVYMRPLAGFLCVNVYATGNYAGEKLLSVGYADEDTPMAGTFSMDMTKVETGVVVGACDRYSATVSLATPYVVGGTLTDAKSLYLVLAEGDYSGTLTITTDKAIYSYDYARKVERNKYYKVNVNLANATARRSIDDNWGGGDGTIEDPYLVATADDVATMVRRCATTSRYAGKHYRQICDIDMTGVSISLTPSSSMPFTGSYDGGGFTISGMTITPTSATTPCAMFGYTSGATISNLTLADVTINADGQYQAAFVADATNTTIKGCKLEGTLNVYNLYSGGIVGKMSGGTLLDCEVKGRVENDKSDIAYTYNGASMTHAAVTGGLVGYATKSAVIEDCIVSGDVIAYGGVVGGVVAHLDGATVRRCRIANTVEIAGIYSYCGGVAGVMTDSSSLISDCRFEGRVNTSVAHVGGMVGSITAGKVYNCISTSRSVSAAHEGNAGGIAGQIYTMTANDIAVIDNCATYGKVEAAYAIGGIVGYLRHTTNGAYAGVTNCAAIGNTLISRGANSSNFNLVGGVAAWTHGSVPGFVFAACVARPHIIEAAPISNLVATQEIIAGVLGCPHVDNGITLTACYTDLTRDKVTVGFETIPTGSGTIRHGALFGYAYMSFVMNSCFCTESLGMHGTVRSSYTCTKNSCAVLTAKQMTDGTMLARLNAASQAYVPATGTPAAKQWEVDASGYPIPSGLPTDTTPASAEPKKVSVIDDSISTFRGYIPYKYSYYYPRVGLYAVSDTYWYRLIYNHMTNARLERNIAYSGSLVTNCNDSRVNSSNTYYAKRFMDQNGVGDADIVIIHGGTNDTTKKVDLAPGITCDSETGPSSSVISSYIATADKAKTRAEIEALNDKTYCEAYIKLVRLVQERNPNVKIVCIIGDHVRAGIQTTVHAIAKHYGAKVVDLYALRGYGNTIDIPKVATSHPNPTGMAFIANKIYVELGNWLEE